MPGIVTNKGLAKAMGERASVDQGKISRRWHVQGDVLPVDDPFTGDEMGIYSAYTLPKLIEILQNYMCCRH